MRARRIHLVSNAHLDPVWLWEWQEGAGEALSTFRQAAEFCETRKGFIFCHNEAVLYRWVEEHEPALFRRIRKLVRAKKWHIMGGWYVQPDCNMPSGESFVRQALLGRRYFAEKFGVEPRTAVNLDPFGHTRGLVQILAKSGYHRLPLLPSRQPRVPPARRRIRLGRLRRLRGPGHPGLGPLLLGRRQGARAAGEVAGRESGRRPGHPPLGHRQPRRRPVPQGPGRPRRPGRGAARPRARPLDAGRLFRGAGEAAGGPAAPREGPQSLGRRLLHLDGPGQAGAPPSRERALLGREDGRRRPGCRASCPTRRRSSRRSCATWPSSSSTTSCPVRPSPPARTGPCA